MPITPTHKATNKETGTTLVVEYDEKTGEYKESFMVCLVKDGWDIVPINYKNPLFGFGDNTPI